MKFISLFSGIGGFDLGLSRVGMQCVGQCEIDPYCQAVLAKHWPHVKRVGDIRNVTEETFERADLICAGFPCQPFSVAGKQRGKEDDRYLWPELLRVIKAYRPTWVLGENVSGIIKMALDTVLLDLENAGYECSPFVIPACAVDAPHRRDRVWIVAHLMGHDGLREGAVPGLFDVANPGCDPKGGPHGKKVRKSLSERKNEYISKGGSARGNVADSRSTKQDIWNQPCLWQPESEWLAESGMGRLAHGVPNRVAQLRALGNAVVPQVVEEIGRAIVLAEKYSNGELEIPSEWKERKQRPRIYTPSLFGDDNE